MFKPWIKKDSDKLPDKYGITVYFVDGTSESFDVASHKFLQNRTLELVLFEDLFEIVILDNVKRVSFDRAFSKIVAERAKCSKPSE